MDNQKEIIYLNKGVFCLSFDFELLYGRSNSQKESYKNRAKKVEIILPMLLNILEENEIGATWAVVGKLHNNKLTQLISKTSFQEIGSHTYSHQYFDLIKKDQAEFEIAESIKVLKKYQKIKSFVFPKNKIKFLDLLNKHDVKIYRDRNILTNSILQILDLNFHFPLTSKLIKKNHLFSNKGTFYFVSGRGIRKYISKDVRFKKARQGIDLAIKRKQIFHMWTHPIDFSEDTEKLLSDFEKIIKYVSKQKRANKINVLTMGQLADY